MVEIASLKEKQNSKNDSSSDSDDPGYLKKRDTKTEIDREYLKIERESRMGRYTLKINLPPSDLDQL